MKLIGLFYANRQEALEAAISERDAQLGLLEVSGIKTARAAERADDLRADRKRLMQLMKQQVIRLHIDAKCIYWFSKTRQNEKRVKLLMEYEENLPGSDNFHAIDSTEDSDDPVCKWKERKKENNSEQYGRRTIFACSVWMTIIQWILQDISL